MIAVAAIHRASFYEPTPIHASCQFCRKKGCEELRKEWGCDAPTSAPQFFIPCVRCSGEDERCELCRGSGYEAIHRCPWSQITEETIDLLYLHDLFPGCLPLAGGLFDQPYRFLQAMRKLTYAKARIKAELEPEHGRPAAKN